MRLLLFLFTFWNANVDAEIWCVKLLGRQLLDGQPLKLVQQQQVRRLQNHLAVWDVRPAVTSLKTTLYKFQLLKKLKTELKKFIF